MRSERLTFHPWTLADLEDAVTLWSHPQVMAKLGGMLSREQIAARLQREIDSQAQHRLQYWRLTQVSDGEFLGCAGLKLTDVPDGTRVVEMGFHLLPKAWGQGYATEAARVALDYAYHELNAPEVYSGHHPENHASSRVLGKLGFERLGELYYPPTGLMHPWYRRGR